MQNSEWLFIVFHHLIEILWLYSLNKALLKCLHVSSLPWNVSSNEYPNAFCCAFHLAPYTPQVGLRH